MKNNMNQEYKERKIMKNKMEEIRKIVEQAGYKICDSWREVNYHHEFAYRLEVKQTGNESIGIPELEKQIRNMLEYCEVIRIDIV